MKPYKNHSYPFSFLLFSFIFSFLVVSTFAKSWTKFHPQVNIAKKLVPFVSILCLGLVSFVCKWVPEARKVNTIPTILSVLATLFILKLVVLMFYLLKKKKKRKTTTFVILSILIFFFTFFINFTFIFLFINCILFIFIKYQQLSLI